MQDNKDNENQDELSIDDVKPLIEERSEKTRLNLLLYIFIASAIALIVHSVYSTIKSWTDNSIPLTICPTTYDLDAPVIMKALRDEKDHLIQDRWVRGFIRRAVLNAYPRTGEDAEKFFKWMVDHSVGELQYKYKTFVGSIDEIKKIIDSGSYVNFYPKDDLDIRIRKSDDDSPKWTVEIDGFLVKNLNGAQQRLTPTLKLEIVAQKPTRNNPSGLYLKSISNDLIADYVSGRKINVD